MREAIVALALFFGLNASSGYGGQKSPAADGKGAPQVMVHVRIMEISRTKLRNLGYYDSLGKKGMGASVLDALVEGDKPKQTDSKPSDGETAAGGSRVLPPDHKFFAALKSLQQRQLVKMLAEPDMLAVSGGTCSVLQGGEFAFPVAQGRKDAAETKPHETSWLDWLCPAPADETAFEFKEYGTRVTVTPRVQPDGTIRVEFQARLSSLDAANSVTANGMTIPALQSREVCTTVELKAGQTLAMGGLVEKRTESTKTPHSADAVTLTVNEVEMLVLVTPELVDATAVPNANANAAVPASHGKVKSAQQRKSVPAAGGQQVMLCVKLAELDRTAARTLAADPNARSKDGSALLQALRKDFGGQTILAQFDNDRLTSGLRELEEHKVVSVLSEPTLVTLSGKTANFIAGGEFAVPTVVGSGAMTTDFRRLWRHYQLHALRARQRPHSPPRIAGVQPARHEHGGWRGAGADRADCTPSSCINRWHSRRV